MDLYVRKEYLQMLIIMLHLILKSHNFKKFKVELEVPEKALKKVENNK